MRERRVGFFTGNRSEYGLLFPILEAVAADPRLEYRLLVSGAHLKEDFGRTLDEIEGDGFHVDAEVPIDHGDDDLLGATRAIGSGVLGTSRELLRLKPEILVVWGDRYEAFAALLASTQMGIPTAHVEGGDYTEGGALDDSVRHAMTKLAHLHLTTNADSAERVRRLGEEAWRVHDVGLPVLDLVAKGRYATRDEVIERLGLDPSRPILVFSQHSVATEHDRAAEQVRPSLAALEEAIRRFGCQAVITYPNDDPGGRLIVAEIEALAGRRVPGLVVRPSLGRFLYHGVLALASACVGNSSSGIKETPSFHCPCVNVGPRQRGRLRAENVIDVGYSREEILAAIGRCLTDGSFREQVETCVSPYGGGDAGRRVAELLATVELGPALIQKKMTY